jgi:hypothetical protein
MRYELPYNTGNPSPRKALLYATLKAGAIHIPPIEYKSKKYCSMLTDMNTI